MRISDSGIELVKAFEGCELTAYIPVPGDVPTIGYGHTSGVMLGNKITKSQAEKFLKNDLVWSEAVVNQSVRVPMDQCQFDSLVSFVFNIGESQFNRSTLLRELNKGGYSKVDHQLGRWVHSNGKRLRGLVRRRKAEADLFSDYAPNFVADGPMPQTVEAAKGKSFTQTVKDSRTAKSGLGIAGFGGYQTIDQINEAGHKLGQLQATFSDYFTNSSVLLAAGLIAAGAYIVYLKTSDIKQGRAY